MGENQTIANSEIKRKSKDRNIQQEIHRKIVSLYFLEIQYFIWILHFILKFDEDLYLRKDRKYNKAIKISLVILKLLNNAQPQNKIKKRLTNSDLILIRGAALGMNLGCDKNYLKTLEKKHPKLLTIPEEYSNAIKYNRVSENNKKDSLKYLDVKGNDFSSYIDPKVIPNDYYYKYLTLLAGEVDYNQELIPGAIPFVADGIKGFLSDIRIEHNDLKYATNNTRYEKSEDSFEVVYFSFDGFNSYMNTWERFLEKYPKKIDKKFNGIIHGESKKNKK